MSTLNIDDVFERRVTFPDPEYHDRLNRLIGLDEYKDRLKKILGLLVNPTSLEAWVKKNHPEASQALNIVLRRPPLVILSGDVGSGKSELAETIGHAVAKQENLEVTLFPLSLSTRGQGRVGEMTQLISMAFEHTISEATKLKKASGKTTGAIILLIDEADAIAQSRENSQMHHEDRAGVNAFIRGIDRIANSKLPAAVIMCTNRLTALDPAVRRRAAEIFNFTRPNEAQRQAVLNTPLKQLGLNDMQINAIVQATGETAERKYGFTFSDLTQKFLPTIILDAYPNSPVHHTRALTIAKEIIPTPPFQDKII